MGGAALRFDEEKYRDISFVTRETGFDAGLIQALVAAFGLAASPFQNQLPASIFYGISRAAGLGDAPAIAAASAAELTAALEQAGKENFIAPLAAEEIEALIERVKGPALIAATTSTLLPGGPTINDLLAPALPDAGLQGRLLGAFVNREGSVPEFWDQAGQDPDFQDKVPALQYGLHLGLLAPDNPSLVAAIRAQRPNATSLADLVLNLDHDQLKEIIADENVSIPASVAGEDEAAQHADYADRIVSTLEWALPTHAAARVLRGAAPAEIEPARLAAPFLDKALSV